MKKIVITVLAAAMVLSACGTKEEQVNEHKDITIEEVTTAEAQEFHDDRINTRNGEIEYDAEIASESELLTGTDVTYQDSYHAQFDPEQNSDLYVATYEYNGKTYTGGYADNCDFKVYMNLPEIASAEGTEINGRDYNIAYYKDNVKAGYYYNGDVCVYVYTDQPMGDEEFKSAIEGMDLHLEEKEAAE